MEEIEEIPEVAAECYKHNKNVVLPKKVPYLGMGASYYAALTLWYLGKNIQPIVASEYYGYIEKRKKQLGVLISQSGESSEVVWNIERFKEIIAVTNNKESSIARSSNCKEVIDIRAKEEEFTSTKTYFNTLVVLYLGLGLDPEPALKAVEIQLVKYRTAAEQLALEIVEYMQSRKAKGLFVLGSGPNAATAMQGALILSEATTFAWNGLPVAQYDHGPKETAQDSVVLLLDSNGKDKSRIAYLENLLQEKSNAFTRRITTTEVLEELSPFCQIMQLNFLMAFLHEKLGASEFIGEKVTRIPNSAKFN